jgi:hypothetical protein
MMVKRFQFSGAGSDLLNSGIIKAAVADIIPESGSRLLLSQVPD